MADIADIDTFIGFLNKCKEDSVHLKIRNLYLVNSPRKDNPGRKLWRVKRQVSPHSHIRHFAYEEREEAIQYAIYVTSLSREDFLQVFCNNLGTV